MEPEIWRAPGSNLEAKRDTTETTEDKNPVPALTESHKREKYPVYKQNSYHMVISHQHSERAGLKGPSHAK